MCFCDWVKEWTCVKLNQGLGNTNMGNFVFFYVLATLVFSVHAPKHETDWTQLGECLTPELYIISVILYHFCFRLFWYVHAFRHAPSSLVYSAKQCFPLSSIQHKSIFFRCIYFGEWIFKKIHFGGKCVNGRAKLIRKNILSNSHAFVWTRPSCTFLK